MVTLRKRSYSILIACLAAIMVVLFAVAALFVPSTTTALAAETKTESLSIFANKGSLSNKVITWSGTNIKFQNAQGSSTSAIRTSDSDHYRVYAKSTITISTLDGSYIDKIVITCTSSSYADVFKNATVTGGKAAVSGSTVTVTADEEKSAVTINPTAQTRVNKVSVTYILASECAHDDVDWGAYQLLDNKQHRASGTCNSCGEAVFGEKENCSIELQDDTYVCDVCNREIPVNTITLMVNGEEYDVLETNVDQQATLPALTEGFGEHTFYGWTSEVVSEEVEAEPENTFEAGVQTFAQSTTLHALYAVGSHEEWTLVTNASALAVDQQVVIAAKDYAVAMSTDQKTNNRGQAAITKSGSTITFGDDVQVFTLKAGTVAGTFAFYTGSGYLYAASNSSNYLKTGSLNENASWAITISGGTASVVAKGSYERSTMQYNSDSTLFACYSSASQKALAIYALMGGATGFTTTIAEEPAEPVEPAFDGATLSIGQTLDVNYYVVLPEAYEGATVDFAMGDITMSGVEGVAQEDGRYVYTFSGIAPQFMGDNIVATLYFDDEVIASMEEYSVKMYATNWLGKEIADDFREVLINLLAYGAAAQKYMNYNVENLVNAGYEVEEPATPDETDFTLTEAQQPAWFTSASVWFDNVNKICVRVSATEEVTLRVNGTDVEMESNVYYTEAIFATEFDETFTFELVVDGEVVQTLTYSVNAYAYAMQNNAKMAELATALYNYGVAADAYVG